MRRTVNKLNELDRGKTAYAVFVLCAATAIVLPAQTPTTLHAFHGANGADPYGALVQAANGDFYGTTAFGGNPACAQGCGAIFKISPSGAFTTIHRFCSKPACADGSNPFDGLILGNDGDLYGTTARGGANGDGTIFKIMPNDKLTTLYSFCSEIGCTDGGAPYGGLVQATNGEFYGTTTIGGGNGNDSGTVFKMTPSGALKTIYSFCAESNCADGGSPLAALIQARNGDLYGTTVAGGAYGNSGTIFKITLSGKLTPLHSFCAEGPGCANGAQPYYGSLVQASNGILYGTTLVGGTGNNGTVFSITPSGMFTTLYRFCSQSKCSDGAVPFGALIQATDGELYGTTFFGGVNGNYGTIFKITTSGTFTSVYSFCSQSGCTDSERPYAGLLQATNGDLYGTTTASGADGYGTVFSLSEGLGPFVKTQPTAAAVGAVVQILGNDLTGTTTVSFHGAVAVFEVVSDSEIKATVPAGATTGKVTVLTPSGTLTSNVAFSVVP